MDTIHFIVLFVLAYIFMIIFGYLYKKTQKRLQELEKDYITLQIKYDNLLNGTNKSIIKADTN